MVIGHSTGREIDPLESLPRPHTRDFIKETMMEALLDLHRSRLAALNSELQEAQATYEDMNDKSTVTHNNITVALAMVATVFLPLNFFTGMFGMNFQSGGHYNIAALNDKYGPLYFLLLCLRK